MGFKRVYDYEQGKRDWGSSGLPREETKTLEPSGGDLARQGVPTCRLDDDLAQVRRRVRESGWETCMGRHNEHDIVLGRLGRETLQMDTDLSVEEAMTDGPSTVRPSIGGNDLVRRMKDKSLTSFVVTTSDGKLVGLVLLEEAEQKLRAE